MRNFLQTHFKQSTSGLILASALLAACTGGGGSVSGGGGGGASGGGSLALTAVYPTSAGKTWTPITASGRFYIKGLSLTIYGTCARGVATVQVNEGGANYPETAGCLVDGTFTWTKTYTGPLDADKNLNILAYDIANNQISGASLTTEVHVDNVPPPAPVITTPGTANFTDSSPGTAFTIIGTCSVDTHVITGDGGSTVTPSGTNWQQNVTLVDGATLAFTYFAYDLAGNQSTSATVSIQDAPSIELGSQSDIDVPGGELDDISAAGFFLESAIYMPAGTTTDLVTNFGLDTGFNYITNSERAN